MIKHGLENITIENPIDENLPTLINYFVKFYGEKYRERITERLTNATYILSDCAGDANTYKGIDDYFNEQTNNLIKNFYKEIGIVYNTNDFSSLNFSDWQNFLKGYNANTIVPTELSKFLKAYLKLENNFASEEKIQDLLADKNSNIKLQKLFAKFDKLLNTKYKPNFDYLESEHKKIIAPYKENFEKINKINEKYQNLRENLIKNHLESNFGIKLDDNSNFIKLYEEILSAKNIELLPNENLEFLIRLAKSKNISFKTITDLTGNKDFKNLIISKELKDKLAQLEEDCSNEIIELNPAYKKLEKILSESDIYPSQILAQLKDFILNTGNVIAYVEHTYKESSPMTPYAVCILPSLFSVCNLTIIHELNHIVTCDILQNLPYSVYYKCGFHTGILDKDLNLFIGNQDASILNEVINDYIAVKINEMMERDGFSLGYLPNTPSAYSRGFALLKDFIEENMDTIIECYMSNDTEISSEKIGASELSNLGKSTSELLYNTNFNKVQQEILLSTQTDKIDYFKLLDEDDIYWSDDTKEYLNYFRNVDLVNQKLRLIKKNPSLARSRSQPQRPNKDISFSRKDHPTNFSDDFRF